jgi:AraC-like DNA-binding protein
MVLLLGGKVQSLIQVSTDMVDLQDRTEFWREVTRPIFDSRSYENSPTKNLEGAYGTKLIGTLLTGYAEFCPQRFVRDWKTISRSGLEDYYMLQLFIGGTAVSDRDGLSLSVADGDVYLFDMGRTISICCSKAATCSLLLPRERIEKACGGSKLHGLLFKAGQPQTKLLADVVADIVKLPAVNDEAFAWAAEEAVISLLALALRWNVLDMGAQDAVPTPILRARVLCFIDEHLTNPGLDINMIMKEFRVSRAHLFRMFDDEGGVMRAIRERRVEAAYKHLMTRPKVSAEGLAHLTGFTGAAQLLRVFRNRYGLTLNDFKQERLNSFVKNRELSVIPDYLAHYSNSKNSLPYY